MEQFFFYNELIKCRVSEFTTDGMVRSANTSL